MTDVELRPVDGTEFPEFFRCMTETFGEDVRPADLDADRWVFEPPRSLAGFDAGRLVATSAAFSRLLALPGGPRPVAAVTMVSVDAAHRRRGVLTAMMRRQLTGLYEGAGEPAAVLWASEGSIYGRFGYGSAAPRMPFRARRSRLRLRPDVDLAGTRVRLATVEEARLHLAAVYERAWPDQVGWLDRPGRWWDYRLFDPEHRRDGGTALRCVLVEEAGEVTGYALYRVRANWSDAGNEPEVQVREVTTSTPAAYAAAWAFLSDLDLTELVTRRFGPPDDPLQHLLADPWAPRYEVRDGLWVRLVDVGRALAERSYAADVDVVLDVDDAFCPWNAGRWRLAGGPGGASCARTGAVADLALSSTDLGAAYLGGTTLASLAAAGRIRECTAGSLTAASRAFGADRQPWCPEVF